MLALLFALGCLSASAQKRDARAPSRKLPAPDKIIGEYLKATGGKKRQAAVRDAAYEYAALLKEQPAGRATVRVKAPASVRTDTLLEEGEINAASNGRSAWERGRDRLLRTLTDTAGNNAKLQSALVASRLVDYKKLNILARTLMLDETGREPAYVLEFSSRNGARVRYWFGVSSHLLLQVQDEARRLKMSFADYRAENGLLEPHRVDVQLGDDAVTLLLQKASFNTGISDGVFDPPSAEALDIPALLRELVQNQKKVDERVSEYSFVEKRTEREINDRGEVKKEKVTVYEVYPLEGGGMIYKLVSEDGKPLTPERLAKQNKNIEEYLAKRERELEKKKAKEAEAAAKNSGAEKKKTDEDSDDVGITTFLKACEFVSPRREKRGEREAVVFDFRPRAGFRPSNMAENIVSKLVGVIWIDPVDKEVIRLEARLSQDFKIAGGLLASIRPGSAFVFEQTRLPEGVWLPLFAQANLMAKVFIFKGVEANEVREFSDYKRYSTDASGYKLESPKQDNEEKKKP